MRSKNPNTMAETHGQYSQRGLDHFQTDKRNAKDAGRQGLEHQLQALRRSIIKDMRQLHLALKANRIERAGVLCDLIARKRSHIQGVASRLANKLEMPPKPADQPTVKPSRSKAKVKRYPRWSDK